MRQLHWQELLDRRQEHAGRHIKDLAEIPAPAQMAHYPHLAQQPSIGPLHRVHRCMGGQDSRSAGSHAGEQRQLDASLATHVNQSRRITSQQGTGNAQRPHADGTALWQEAGTGTEDRTATTSLDVGMGLELLPVGNRIPLGRMSRQWHYQADMGEAISWAITEPPSALCRWQRPAKQMIAGWAVCTPIVQQPFDTQRPDLGGQASLKACSGGADAIGTIGDQDLTSGNLLTDPAHGLPPLRIALTNMDPGDAPLMIREPLHSQSTMDLHPTFSSQGCQ